MGESKIKRKGGDMLERLCAAPHGHIAPDVLNMMRQASGVFMAICPRWVLPRIRIIGREYGGGGCEVRNNLEKRRGRCDACETMGKRARVLGEVVYERRWRGGAHLKSCYPTPSWYDFQ